MLTNSEFRKAFLQLIVGMTKEEIGDLLHVSLPTIERWREGKNLPYRLAQIPILMALKKKKSG